MNSIIIGVFFMTMWGANILDAMDSVHARKIPSGKFLSRLPDLSFRQAGMIFDSYHPNQQRLITIDGKFHNELIQTIFLIVQLNEQAQEHVVDHMLINPLAQNKFLTMPIGRAIYEYQFAEKASRGRMIFLPQFNDQFKVTPQKCCTYNTCCSVIDTKKRCDACLQNSEIFIHPELLDKIKSKIFLLSSRQIMNQILCKKIKDGDNCSREELTSIESIFRGTHERRINEVNFLFKYKRTHNVLPLFAALLSGVVMPCVLTKTGLFSDSVNLYIAGLLFSMIYGMNICDVTVGFRVDRGITTSFSLLAYHAFIMEKDLNNYIYSTFSFLCIMMSIPWSQSFIHKKIEFKDIKAWLNREDIEFVED